MTEFVTAIVPPTLVMPPPPPLVAVFWLTAEPMMSSVPWSLRMPAPKVAVFPRIVALLTVSVP